MESVRMRTATRIVAAPDRAARYQALHRRAAHGLTTTTAPGHWHALNTRPAWQNTTRTHPGGEEKHTTVSTDVWSRGAACARPRIVLFPPLLIFRRVRRCFPFLCGPLSAYFPPSELSYSGRPVEGAASRAARQLCGCIFYPLFFFFAPPVPLARALPRWLPFSSSHFSGENHAVQAAALIVLNPDCERQTRQPRWNRLHSGPFTSLWSRCGPDGSLAEIKAPLASDMYVFYDVYSFSLSDWNSRGATINTFTRYRHPYLRARTLTRSSTPAARPFSGKQIEPAPMRLMITLVTLLLFYCSFTMT